MSIIDGGGAEETASVATIAGAASLSFLGLVNRTRMECGIAGGDAATLTGAGKELARLKAWVAQSWLEIQQITDWDFMRRAVSFDTIAGKQSYTPSECGLEDFGRWKDDTFRCYLKSQGTNNELFLSQCTYPAFRDFYLFGSRRGVTNRPTVIAVGPDRSLYLGFSPNDVYTVNGEYYTTPQMLVADEDIPIMPERYHTLIVYRAMVKYGMFESAQEQVTVGQQQYNEMLNRMRADQGPQVFMGDSFI